MAHFSIRKVVDPGMTFAGSAHALEVERAVAAQLDARRAVEVETARGPAVAACSE